MKQRTTGSIAAIAAMAVGALVLTCCRPAAVEIAYPVENAHRTFVSKVQSRLVGCFRGAAVEAENARLRQEAGLVAALRGDLARLELENVRLRKALGYAMKNHGTWKAAEVLSRGGGAAGVLDTIRVNKGSLDGSQKGAVVVAAEGLVGKVTAVSPHTSEVTLITDPSLRVACEVQVEGGVPVSGILSGGSDERLVLRHLRNAADGLPQSRVLTSGRGGVFPRGIEVGTLLAMTNRVRSAEGEVLPCVDYSTLEDVFIRCAQ